MTDKNITSKAQIKEHQKKLADLRKKRKKPTLTYEPRPEGPAWKTVFSQASIDYNRKLNEQRKETLDEITDFRQRLKARRNQAKNQFNRSKLKRAKYPFNRKAGKKQIILAVHPTLMLH